MANPLNVRVVSYASHRARKLNIGATAMRRGSICKFSSGLLIPASDNEENAILWVTLQEAAASATDVLCVPIQDCVMALLYTGTVPTAPTAIGVAYGITGPITLDFDNTTQILLTVVDIDTSLGIVYCVMQNISI